MTVQVSTINFSVIPQLLQLVLLCVKQRKKCWHWLYYFTKKTASESIIKKYIYLLLSSRLSNLVKWETEPEECCHVDKTILGDKDIRNTQVQFYQKSSLHNVRNIVFQIPW